MTWLLRPEIFPGPSERCLNRSETGTTTKVSFYLFPLQQQSYWTPKSGCDSLSAPHGILPPFYFIVLTKCSIRDRINSVDLLSPHHIFFSSWTLVQNINNSTRGGSIKTHVNPQWLLLLKITLLWKDSRIYMLLFTMRSWRELVPLGPGHDVGLQNDVGLKYWIQQTTEEIIRGNVFFLSLGGCLT